MEPLQIVTATPPIEATLRILLNSVPYLIGCAVVRQPAGPDAVAAEVGRNPWLFDRRLTTLQLPDDTLPANRAVALDWPVPYQAEWVGVPPRLLISRLVFDGRTIGVLLGTLMTREQLSAQTREALGLSCELIASAMATASFGGGVLLAVALTSDAVARYTLARAPCCGESMNSHPTLDSSTRSSAGLPRNSWLLTTPGCSAFTVTPVPARRRASSRANSTLASLERW